MNSEVAFNIKLIKGVEEGREGYKIEHLSTSQQVMAGLALCRPDLLEIARYPADHIRLAWGRLNDEQRQAVIAWWEH